MTFVVIATPHREIQGMSMSSQNTGRSAPPGPANKPFFGGCDTFLGVFLLGCFHPPPNAIPTQGRVAKGGSKTGGRDAHCMCTRPILICIHGPLSKAWMTGFHARRFSKAHRSGHDRLSYRISCCLLSLRGLVFQSRVTSVAIELTRAGASASGLGPSGSHSDDAAEEQKSGAYQRALMIPRML